MSAPNPEKWEGLRQEGYPVQKPCQVQGPAEKTTIFRTVKNIPKIPLIETCNAKSYKPKAAI